MKALSILALTHTYPRHTGDTNGPFVEFLMEELAARGHRVRVLTAWDALFDPDRPGRRVQLSTYRYAPFDSWHRLGYSRTIEADVRLKKALLLLAPLMILAGTWSLWREVRRERPDLLHAHWFLPNGCMAGLVGWITGVPLVSTLHGSDVFVAEKGFPYSLMRRVALAATGRLTSCSPELRDRICRLGFPRRLSHVIPYAADPALLAAPPAPEAVSAERQHWLEGGEGPLIFALGRLVYKKGFDVLLEALPAVARAHPGLRLVIGGEGDLEHELKDQARRLGIESRVCFTGRLLRDRIGPLMGSCDLFVMPSVRDRAGNIDGLPNVILEAMALGRPVVATAVAGIPLAVIPDHNGLLVPERDPVALAAALGEALSDGERLARWGRNSRALIEDRLNWPAVAARYEAVFAKLLADREGPR